ncbi:hypothetical protein SAMN04489738_2190 [Pseudarthrobacter chlorophenolicus]|nr:hypothetical protein SAMN04489738_2190 [Pseudarthrobacter chlorophenolicus]
MSDVPWRPQYRTPSLPPAPTAGSEANADPLSRCLPMGRTAYEGMGSGWPGLLKRIGGVLAG